MSLSDMTEFETLLLDLTRQGLLPWSAKSPRHVTEIELGGHEITACPVNGEYTLINLFTKDGSGSILFGIKMSFNLWLEIENYMSKTKAKLPLGFLDMLRELGN